MKNVLWIVPGFAAHEADSSCLPPLQALARSLTATGGVEIEILSLHYPFAPSRYRWNGIPVHALGGRNRPYPARLAWWATALRAIHSEISRRRPALLHAFWAEEAAFLAALAARAHRLPLTCTLMGQDALPSNRWLRWLPLSRLHTVAVSDFQAEVWQQTTGHAAGAVIPWGLRAEDFSKKTDSEKTYDLLGVGSLIPLKRYDWFLEVVEKLLPARPGLRTALIGSGPERPRLEALARARGLPVDFLGQQPRETALDWMRRSRVLLHPSRYESYGYVLAEALACGAAVVAAPVGLALGHPHIRTATDVAGLAAHCAEALTQPNPDATASLPRVEDTARRYGEWYGGMVSSLSYL
jgi:glycosyltransferase involved in cell wall biosynthesis